VPYCPCDDAAQAVLSFARRGGAVYLSGDVFWDTTRKRTRTDRLPELCGVSFVQECYPDIQTPRDPAPSTAALVDTPLGKALAETPLRGPCIETRGAGAVELARCGEVPLAWLHHPGQGTVLYVSDPLELHTSPYPVLAAFLDQLGDIRRRDLAFANFTGV
jgi:hypothetical protein